MSNTSSNSCNYNPWDDNIADKRFIIYTLLAPFTILFNLAVLLIAFKFVRWKERLDQWYVINMTLPNLIFGLVFLFVTPYSFTFPKPYCRLYYVTLWTCTATSTLYLLLLNVHKFITLFMPYKAQQLVSRRNALVQIITVFVVVIIYTGVSSTKLIFDESEPCFECNVKPEPHLYTVMMTVFFVCPLIVSLLISIYIFVLAQMKTKHPAGSSTGNDGQMIKRIFFVFSYTVFNALALIPYRMYYSIYMFCTFSYSKDSQAFKSLSATAITSGDGSVSKTDEEKIRRAIEDNCLNRGAMSWLLCLLPLACLINPLITIITQRAYREGAKKLCGGVLNCARRRPSIEGRVTSSYEQSQRGLLESQM